MVWKIFRLQKYIQNPVKHLKYASGLNSSLCRNKLRVGGRNGMNKQVYVGSRWSHWISLFLSMWSFFLVYNQWMDSEVVAQSSLEKLPLKFR